MKTPTITINGEEIRGMDSPSYEVKPMEITIKRYFDYIEITVKDFQGNTIEGETRKDILKEILPIAIKSLS